MKRDTPVWLTSLVKNELVKVVKQNERKQLQQQSTHPFCSLDRMLVSSSRCTDAICFSNISDKSNWLIKNFGNFSMYATLNDLPTLNANISRFLDLVQLLDLLTPSQAAELTLISGVLNSTSQIDLVFNRLEENDTFTNVDEFLTGLADQVKDINPAVRDVMMNRTIKIISTEFAQFQTSNWTDWFKVKLISLLPSFTAEMLIDAVSNISCTNYQVIVEALSNVSVNMPVNRNQALGAVLLAYLKQSTQQINQTACRGINQTDADWLSANLGHFSSYVSFSQLTQFNISLFGSLDLLTPSQAAELTVSSGVLNSTSQIDLVFNRLEKGDAFTNVDDFFSVLSGQKIHDIIPAVRDVMLNRTFTIISVKFSQFQTSDWMHWFKVNLITLLPSFTAEMLTKAMSGISCTNYQVIVEALSNVSVNMPVNRNQALGAVLLAYLKQSTQQINQTACRGINQTDADWLSANLGHFSSYMSFSQLTQFNISWFGSLDLLTPSQAAELTVSSGVLNSTSQIDLVFNRLEKGDAFTNVDDFFSVLSGQKIHDINPAVRDVMLNRTFTIISVKFSQFQTSDWMHWFKVNLITLLPSFTVEMLTKAMSGISCTNYQVIVEALSNVSVNMPVNRNQALGAVLLAYLKQSTQQINQTACRGINQTDADWLSANLGHFSSYVSFSQLTQFNISLFGSLDLLTPSQAAELTVSSGVLNSTSQIDLVFNRLEKGDAFTNMDDFFSVLSGQKIHDINPAVRDVMLNRTFTIISVKFSQFQTSDWMHWFKVNLITLLPSFTVEMLTKAMSGISCTNYQVIVEALSNVSVNMPVNRNQALGAVLLAYLKQSTQQINQTACRGINQTDADWLSANLGHFSSYVSFSQLTKFNISLFGSLDLLTPSQAAELTVSSGVLNSTSQIDLVFNRLEKGDAFTNVDDFFSVLSGQKIHDINPAVRDVMLNRTFTIISIKFSQFQTSDWMHWFKFNLITLLPSFTAEMLTKSMSGISCTNYQVNAAEVLTLSQLAELCSTPSSLQGPQDVNTVMAAVKPDQFAAFFDILTPNIQRNASLYSSEVKEAFLQAVLVRGGLSSAAVPDSEVLQVSSLDSMRSSFNSDTQTQIYSNIQQLLTGPNGLGCYNGGSFYAFLKNSFLSFGFPDLSAFLSLIPASRQRELLGSISPGELSEFLNGSTTVRNEPDLCTLLNNYNSTNQYLQMHRRQGQVSNK
ncbi:uncharacterized protein LOC119264717 [Pygocentrus nattereri]|uniref:uncharacterized protein LOC119264717 n=1 Tax=Pygocentrus nattereri TaxID=42514 RepID=UPI0018915138|nr:uncharacterized protein LOC119264717 [Pygocentrus nattereri]